jgi:hypothetical protein
MLADAGPGPALYEICNAWHHHFVCLNFKDIVLREKAMQRKTSYIRVRFMIGIDERELPWFCLCSSVLECSCKRMCVSKGE